ncbi:hypothetical protein [Streptomyces sp. NPDC059994]|uniref:hypothetical protein n=1 Tax=Streptomyces sp. NPDC059994 TaxID=3347029 RepID=UPI0036A62F46
MITLPLAAPEREAAREQITPNGLARAIRIGARAYYSYECQIGRHQDSAATDRCTGGPAQCLCECHDPKDETT